jgi:hypothetical protein
MPQYLLSVWFVEGTPELSEEEMTQSGKDVDSLNDELRRSGAWVFGGGLHPADTATVVQVKGSDTVTTDGPFAESKEHLGGFWVIRADDLDAALAIGRRAAVACRAAIEVRPFVDEPEG